MDTQDTSGLVMSEDQVMALEERANAPVEQLGILREILSTLRSQQKEGISSVEIETNSRGTNVSCKAYSLDVHEAGEAALTEYRRLRQELGDG